MSRKRKGGITFKVTAEGLAKCSAKTRRRLMQVICQVFRESGAEATADIKYRSDSAQHEDAN